MALIDEIAPSAGSLLGFTLEQPISEAVKHMALDWLPWRVGDHTMGEHAAWKKEPPFEASLLLHGHDGPLDAVEVVVQVERPQIATLDALEKDVKKRLRQRFGPFAKSKQYDSRPHWVEAVDPPVVWMTLRWKNFASAGLQVIMRATR